MRVITIKKARITLTLFIAWVLQALSATSFASGHVYVEPTFVGCFPGGTCFIGVSTPINVTPCEHKLQIRFDITLPGSDAQYSAALLAFSSKKRLRVHITNECLSGYPVPGWLYVVDD